MRYPEEELIAILRSNGVDFTSLLPCEKIKVLLETIEKTYSVTPLHHVPLTREEEGVGVSAGAALSGKRPAMFVQSSGIGNMINALLSLTGFYELPLAVFVSRRGIYKEKIEAQVPMGERLPMILRGAGISYTIINEKSRFNIIDKKLSEIYRKNLIHAFLLSPAIWEKSGARSQKSDSSSDPLPHSGGFAEEKGREAESRDKKNITFPERSISHRVSPPRFTRYEILDIIAPYLASKVVVCNLGLPAKELYHIKHQPSNFYMLGSMGMVTPIGLGISLTTDKQVVVVDGDGSLLMNPGSLATAAYLAPENLTIFAIDNGTYGSTGDQPTLASSCVDLEVVAKGFGVKNTVKAATKKQLIEVMKETGKGLRFIHALAIPGNKDVPNIPLHHIEIRKLVQDFLR